MLEVKYKHLLDWKELQMEKTTVLQAQVTKLTNQLEEAEEYVTLKIEEVTVEKNREYETLQHVHKNLETKLQVLEVENTHFRKRFLTFEKLNSLLEKKLLDEKNKKNLDKATLSSLAALSEAQRRIEYLEGQLRANDDTLLTVRNSLFESSLVLEQDIFALENSVAQQKFIYEQLLTFTQEEAAKDQQEAEEDEEEDISDASEYSGSESEDEKKTTNKKKQEKKKKKKRFPSSRWSLEWLKYTSLHARYTRSESTRLRLTESLNLLENKYNTTVSELDSLKKENTALIKDLKAVKADLIRNGIALKTLADDNFEMKEYMRMMVNKDKKK